jgi:disulfide oxidoreductase YuzD
MIHLKVLAILSILVYLQQLLPYNTFYLVKPNSNSKLHVCVKTNDIYDIEHLINYYIYQGATSFSIYNNGVIDDSSIAMKYAGLVNKIDYFYKIENNALEHCYANTADYIIKISDNEYFYPIKRRASGDCSTKVKDVLDQHYRDSVEACVSLPIRYFGYGQSVARDRDVVKKDYLKKQKKKNFEGSANIPMAFYMYKNAKALKIKRRPTRRVFINNNTTVSAESRCHLPYEPPLAVAHYTKKINDQYSFSMNKAQIKRRLREKNRFEQLDKHILRVYNCFDGLAN